MIHYLGHEYPAHLFQDNLTKWAQEFQMNQSMQLQEQEHLSDRWTASAARDTSNSSNRRQLLGSSSCHYHRSSNNSSTKHLTVAAAAKNQSLSSRSEHSSRSSVRCRTDATSSSSSLYDKLVGSLPSAAAASLTGHQHYYEDMQETKRKQQRWTTCLQRWGYTNHDVLDIVQDDQVWSKLQRDLRSRHAITNTLIEQRIHVFVRNTKYKKNKNKQQQQQQQEHQLQDEQLHDQEPQEDDGHS